MPGPCLVGLTGGIAAGKSEVLRLLAEHGAETISTDAVVHDLLAGDEVGERLIARWGEEVAPQGALERDRIAAIVFERPKELRWLESLLHPLVGERVLDWRRSLRDDLDVAVAEIPLLFESEMEAMFDATVAVLAADEQRDRRAAARGTGSIEGREQRQLSQEEKAARATFVVRNDGSLEDLAVAVAELYEGLKGLGGARRA